MEKTKNIIFIIGLGITIGVVLVAILVFVMGANPTITLILGSILLIAGSILFILFIFVIGGVTGLVIGRKIVPGPEGAEMIWGCLGLIMQVFIILLAGFLTGIHVLNVLAGIFHDGALSKLIVYSLAGIIDGSLVILFIIGVFSDMNFKNFGWTITIFSSLAGASFIIQSFIPVQVNSKTLFIILFLAGIFIQRYILNRISYFFADNFKLS